MNRKQHIAELLDRTGVLSLDLRLRPVDTVIAVNYHGTPAGQAQGLAGHLAFYRDHFECLDEDRLLGFLRGTRRLHRPGIVLTFDDGLRSNSEVAGPLLLQHGLRGWFMVPGAFLDAPEAAQRDFYQRRILERPDPSLDPGPAMTWEGARALARGGHVIGCHSWSHESLGPSAPQEVIEEEVVRARALLEERLQRPVRTFCWVRGRVEHYSAPAHEAVRRAYQLAFMTMSRGIRPETDPLELHRFNVEASFPLSLLRFQISRLNEAYFARRRRQVERVIRG